ncbi:MAG: ribosome-associated translation inhibitor RaiA [Erysipelotrichaceae bacterium]|nr:ribosome-associated translation inhibitor RaiA [Erysipelotrichaceae bacterium]
MKFIIYGENVTITEEMRGRIEEKLSFLNKYLTVDENTTARVTVKIYGDSLKVEVTIPTKVGLLRSEVIHDDFYTAVDLAIDKLEDQIRKQKGRLSRRHKDSLAEAFIAADAEEGHDDVAVRTKTVYAEEMVLDEAIMKMEMLSHSFFIYRDADEDKIAVVYRRNDGQYGLIEINE